MTPHCCASFVSISALDTFKHVPIGLSISWLQFDDDMHPQVDHVTSQSLHYSGDKLVVARLREYLVKCSISRDVGIDILGLDGCFELLDLPSQFLNLDVCSVFRSQCSDLRF